ncbi:MAG: hypothetical protein JXA73_17155 [Acidobacteria bacterium]|nr:hypothetical protein [Acidobacteriota bacterium]
MQIVRLPRLLLSLGFVLLVSSGMIYSQDIIPSDRRIDWSYAGIPGGIPNRTTICKTIDSATYGNGSTDATSAIQAALNNCPADQVVYLPAGIYQILGTLTLRSHTTLRGAGQGITILRRSGASTSNIIQVSNGTWDALIGSPDTRSIASAVKDARTVTLSSTSGISVGDVLLLNQINSGDVVNAGTNGKCTFCGLSSGDRSLGQFVEVSAIMGNQVSITTPLHWTYDTSLAPYAYVIHGSAITRWAGIESMTITQSSTPPNAASSEIFWQGMQYGWVRNVEFNNMYSNAIMTYYAFQCEFSHNNIHDSLSHGVGGGYGIALSMYSSNNLIENNILANMSEPVLTGTCASGNVVAYNYTIGNYYEDSYWAIGSPAVNHGTHPKMNLFEGNIGHMWDGDFIWGSSSHNTMFRSYQDGAQPDTTKNNAAVRLAGWNRYHNIVGSILGTPGKSNAYEATSRTGYDNNKLYIWVLGITDSTSDPAFDDPQVSATIYRHGNYDYVTNSAIWDSGNSNHALPNSLYLSAKPSWWCSEAVWPPIGPDVTGMTNAIPAKRRFEGLSCTLGDATLGATKNLRVVSSSN